MKLALIATAGLALSATASAQTVDLGGAMVDGGADLVFSMVMTGPVTGVAWDLDVSTLGGSWASEINVLIEGPGGFSLSLDGSDTDFSDDGPADITFGWPDGGGSFTAAGSAAISGAAGTYTITLSDDFDDSGTDHMHNAGSSVTLIPTPGSAAILALGGVAATRRRR